MQGFFQFLADNPYILLFFTVGMAGRFGGWKLQNWRSASFTVASGGSTVGVAPGAPAAIHARIFSVSLAVGNSTASSLASLSGGICPFTMRW